MKLIEELLFFRKRMWEYKVVLNHSSYVGFLRAYDNSKMFVIVSVKYTPL